MPQISQRHDATEKDPAQLRTHIFRAFTGVHTSASRNAIPDDKVYNLENVIPVGPQNAQVVANISEILQDFTTNQIYYSQYVSLHNIDYLACFAKNGNVYNYNISSNSAVLINPGLPLSGSSSRMAQWSDSAIVIIDSTGLYAYDSTGLAFHLISGIGVPTSGDQIAVYSSRVWVTQGRILFNSGAGGYEQPYWIPQNGAAFNVLIDSQIRSKVTNMTVANGVMYLFAGSAINVIFNVIVPIGAVPPTPFYTNQNIQPLIGTDQPDSVIPFDQSTLFANKYGAYRLYGVSAPKISDDIDGTWQHIDFTQNISAGQVVVEGILCGAFLIKRLGDLHFSDGSILAIWMNKDGKDNWWFGNFGNITLVTSAVLNGIATLFCFIGNKLYRLFSDTTSAPSVLIETKLWPLEDDIQAKEAMRVGFLAEYSVYGSEIDMSVDGLNVSSDANITLSLTQGSWMNPSLETGFWFDPTTDLTGGWITTGFLLASGSAPGMFSHNLGLTLTSTGYRYRLNLMAIDYKLRDRWV